MHCIAALATGAGLFQWVLLNGKLLMLKPHIYKSNGWWRVTAQPFPLAKSNALWAQAYSWVAARNSKEHDWTKRNA